MELESRRSNRLLTIRKKFQDFSKNFQKTLDKQAKVCYNIGTKVKETKK
jgi:hypothetical protein